MSELWKEIFHDSDDYIRLILNDDINLDNCSYIYDDNDRLTSMIVGIPYRFTDVLRSYQALYLCGVSTLPEMRGKGEIQRLMRDIEHRAAVNDYDFTFLIPANEKLRLFYKKYGYQDMEYATSYSTILQNNNSTTPQYLKENVLSADNIRFSINDSADNRLYEFTQLYGNSYYNFVIDCKELLQNIEKGSGNIFLTHSVTQWEKVCHEWIMSGNDIYLITDNNITPQMYAGLSNIERSNLIKGIAFVKREIDSQSENHKHDTPDPRPYGMMKKLSIDLPASEEFGISFMMD